MRISSAPKVSLSFIWSPITFGTPEHPIKAHVERVGDLADAIKVKCSSAGDAEIDRSAPGNAADR